MPKDKSLKTFDDSDDVKKAFLSRIPQEVDEATLRVLLETQFSTTLVDLTIVTDNSVSEKDAAKAERTSALASALDDVLTDGPTKKQKKEKLQKGDNHLGYGYATFEDEDTAKAAIAAGVVRTARKRNIHIAGVRRESKETRDLGDDGKAAPSGDGQCFLWARFACSHGTGCIFRHDGPGGCLASKGGKGKCFDWVKKGSCKKGEACTFEHDESKKGGGAAKQQSAVKRKRVEGEDDKDDDEDGDGADDDAAAATAHKNKRDDKDKDCIEWKTKGKCRKGDQCAYKHCDLLRQKALSKKKASASASAAVPNVLAAAGGGLVARGSGSSSSSTSASVLSLPSRPSGCLSLKIFGLSNNQLKRRDVSDVLRQSSVQHARKVTIPDGIDADSRPVVVEFKSGKSVEDAMIVLGTNENYVRLFGKNIRGGNVKRVKVSY